MSWPLDHRCQCWNGWGWHTCLLSSWRKSVWLATLVLVVRKSLVLGAARLGLHGSSRSTILRLKRTGKMQKAGWLQMTGNENKPQNTKKHKPNTRSKKISRKLSEILRFQNNKILGALSSSVRRHAIPTSKKLRIMKTSGFAACFSHWFFFPALPDKCETWSVNNWN